MNADQRQAFDFVKGGHNVFIGGQAGCGKSFIVREIFSWAEEKGRNIAVTCTTGVACSLFPKNFNAMTIHRWSGIGDGRFDLPFLKKLLEEDDGYSEARKRIIECDILIIDEISMLSLKMFEKLDGLMSYFRKNEKPLGGIQLVVSGDFLQLPPVSNRMYKDKGEFCFISKRFPVHKFILKHVIRQCDEKFSRIINNISIGDLDLETYQYIKHLERPLHHSNQETIRLFASNNQVDMYNREKILKVSGQLYVYEAIDEGKEKFLATLLVPKTLWLKINAKVLLLRNLSDKLVNGLRGKVASIREGEVDVFFPSISLKCTLSRISFNVYDPGQNRNIAVRQQLPIKLCYAMTVNKAQGMTLERVEVDCRNMFQPGQLAVAMGRVKSADGLRVINLSGDVVTKQPDIVLQYLEQSSLPIKSDMSCCAFW